MHRRFVCSDCHLKWFVQADAPRADDPTHCPGCNGLLVPLRTAPVIPPQERQPTAGAPITERPLPTHAIA